MLAVERNKAEHVFAMTHAQKRIWYGEVMHADTTLHLLTVCLVFRGLIDQSKLAEAIQGVVDRHDALRIRILPTAGDEEPALGIFAAESIPVAIHDFIGLEDEVWKEEIRQREQQIPLRSPWLIRFALLRVAEDEARILISAHHLIVDGMSLIMIGQEINHMYTQSLGYNIPNLDPAPSFLEQVHNESAYLESTRFERDRLYWQEQFKTIPPVSRLKPQGATNSNLEGGILTLSLEPQLRQSIYRFSKEEEVSPAVLFMAVLCLFFLRTTGEKEVLLGTHSSNRTTRETKAMAGMLVSTMPFRMQVGGSETFRTFIQSVKRRQNETFRHQKYPYNLLVPMLREEFGISDQPLEVFMNYLPIDWHNPSDEVKYHFEPGASWHQANELTLFVYDYLSTEEIQVQYQYCATRFTREEMGFFHDRMMSLLKNALLQPELPINRLDMLPAGERRLILEEFVGKGKAEPPLKTVVQCFEDLAAHGPDRSAVVHEGEQWSYGELNDWANRLARLLLKQGLKPEDKVGIWMNRSISLIASILAVWKAGGAYIPLDPEAPAERSLGIIHDSKMKLLLISEEQIGKIRSSDHLQNNIELLVLEELDDQMASCSTENLKDTAHLDSLAYIIFTSGSTGRPKGALLEHKGMMNHITAMAEELGLSDCSTVAQNASQCFDVSVWQMFAGLCAGGRTIIYSSSLLQKPEEFLERLITDKVTILELVPSYLSVLLESLENRHRPLPDLSYLIPTGEALKRDTLKRWFALYPDIPAVNAYGPTEASDDITLNILREAPPQETVPIGRPLSGLHIYIVDEAGQLCPIGVKGEIWVSGVGVGRGYLNDPERTASAFTDDPFVPEQGRRLYKTGDLGSWQHDGTIEFFGRKDHQVKIRGFRIELGEIDGALVNHPDIIQAVTVGLDDGTGERTLCVYYTSKRTLEVGEAKSYLEAKLPNYMVPSFFMQLEDLPLTPNGKVDREALPQPDKLSGLQQAYAMPRNQTESQLVELWMEILGMTKLGIRDNFFELGGHSLKAITLLSRIHKLFHVEISLAELFRLKTIEKLAALVLSSGRKQYEALVPAAQLSVYPLTSGQKRLHLLQQFQGAELSYNMPAVLEVKGALSPERLHEALIRLIDRHEPLRTRFALSNEGPVQLIESEVNFALACCNLEGEGEDDIRDIIRSFIRPFDLREAPLLRTMLIRLGNERYLLLFDMHHAITDGTSLGVLMHELSQLYKGEQLEPLHLQYKDYAVWQQQFMRSAVYREQEAFWLEQFRTPVPLLDLPLDRPRPLLRDFTGGRVHFAMDSRLTREVKRLSRLTETTLFTLLLAAYGLLLAKLSGQDEVMVGTPVAGRRHADVERMAGMFINTLPLHLQPASSQSFAGYLRQVKQCVIGALEHQDYPFEELVEKVSPPRDISRNPLFDAMFVLQNMETPKLALGDAHLAPYLFEFPTAKFDLTLTVMEQEDTLSCHLEYASALITHETAERWAGFYIELLNQIVSKPGFELRRFHLLSEADRQQVGRLFLKADEHIPTDEIQTIHGLIELQAERTPDRTAIECGGERVTYRELNRIADRLAARLRAKGVQREDVVALLADRSIGLIAGLLAVNKAGAAYLPLDPDYPKARIRMMLEDSRCRHVVTQSAYAYGEKGLQGMEVVLLDQEDMKDQTDSADYGTQSGETKVLPTDLAYVIYTSGSTGKPKGAMIEHRSVYNLLQGMTKEIPLAELNSVLSLTTASFDIFVLETLLPLMLGSKVVLATRDEQLDTGRLAELCLRKGVELLQGTPSRLRILLGSNRMAEALAAMRCVLIGGEPLDEPLLKQLREVTPARLFNVYGPTETTVWSTVKEITTDARITIGSPILNTRVYILNTEGQLQPIGVPGELFIAGKGVARGYMNRQTLTEQRFIAEPADDASHSLPTSRMYRTGDRARYLADGSIEYLGRLDDQFKIRGYRVEPGEISAVLGGHPLISAAIVTDGVDKSGQGVYLAAYYESASNLPPAELREYVGQQLPAYMIPSYFIRLDRLPMTPNGKVDKRALPTPAAPIAQTTIDKVPRSESERILFRLWKDVLGLNEVGRHDNFFELGGHSLHAAQLVEKIRRESHADLSLTDFFMYPTIAALAKRLSGSTSPDDRVSAAEVRADERKALMRKQRQARKSTER
ncbi:non-ribosomal peptide synthetase [Paenibacillus elgii]|uniref:Non-ribosomal peptide synthetase n=1 Tax=Paenibacillus elgii TaxID=189691 RepID=A0A2T6FY49_9BACL|nr:non-ribosomal peptide synthetase [Paenibacillus elgii]PUA36836.1 non-ribosomal peptide synthetase [Paenibacillus elgii]